MNEETSRTSPGCCLGSNADTRQPVQSVAPQPVPAGRARPDRLVAMPGGVVEVGTRSPVILADGEGPPRRMRVKPFLMDPYAVTNAWFAEFVAATGYRTEAESYGWSMVFDAFLPGRGEGRQRVVGAEWWCKVEGAYWAQPEGPGSSVEARSDHPVVHVTWGDANAFAAWAGGRLPTEAEWEHAAKGGDANARYAWGDAEPDDQDFQPCNIWQGRFPDHNTARDGFAGTAPVDSFAPNPMGLYNMCGNVWEWTADPFRVRSARKEARLADERARQLGSRLLKGGSYLCHKSYCYRYRIAARSSVTPDSSTGHLGMRLVFDT